jgi:DNA-binding NarL/FixJ family response regulator
MSCIVLVAREPELALQWRSALASGGPHEVVAVARGESEPLLEVLRAGADNFCVAAANGALVLAAYVEQTLRDETALTAAIARALLEHFERSHAQLGRHRLPGDEQGALELEAPQRELLMRLAAGYDVERLAQAQTVVTRVLGQRLRAVVRKLQWDVRAGSLTLQLS